MKTVNIFRKRVALIFLLAAIMIVTGSGAAAGVILSGQVNGKMPVAVSQALLVDTPVWQNSILPDSNEPQQIYRHVNLVHAPFRGVGVVADDNTAFEVAAELATGDWAAFNIPLKNASPNNMTAEISLDVPDGLEVEIYAATAAINISSPVRTGVNIWKFGLRGGADFDAVEDCLTVVISVDDNTVPGYFKIRGTLKQVNIGKSNSLFVATSPIQFTINEYPVPVFAGLVPDQEYVIKDNAGYKFYYAGNDFLSINLAQSPDGIHWTPYVHNPIISDAQYHSDVKYYATGFPGTNSGTDPSGVMMHYRMWYQGLNGHSIAGWIYAESPDGIDWYNRIPVSQFGPTVFDGIHAGVHYGIADVVYTPGAANTGTDWIFRIYVNLQWEDAPYGGKELVVMAFSSNGYNWTGYDPLSTGQATPIFTGTLNPVTFDCDHIGWFKVVKNSSTDWQAFYSGGKDTTYQALNGIGYATSTDGISWTRRQTLFTSADGVAWRNQSVWMPSVVKTGNNYQIWFLGSDNPNIGMSDWIQWKLGYATLTQ